MEELDSIWNFGLYRYLCVIYNSSNTIQVIIHVGSYLNFGLLIEIERNRYRYIGSYFIVNNTTSISLYIFIYIYYVMKTSYLLCICIGDSILIDSVLYLPVFIVISHDF